MVTGGNLGEIMKFGARGSEVMTIQNMLGQIGYQLVSDGIYGKHTTEIVKEFQESVPGLAIDGVVGPKTMAALRQAVKDSSMRPDLQPEQFSVPEKSPVQAAALGDMDPLLMAAIGGLVIWFFFLRK